MIQAILVAHMTQAILIAQVIGNYKSKYMKKFLIDSLAPFYLGGALSAIGNVHYYQWQFWAIIVPFFLLVKITNFNQD
jgi:hypothetical protein